MRITGGELRSRRLVAPRGDATRPTSDRVREALFSILGGLVEIEGARVLDLYAGTGALAFEALSRGAASAVLVERARPALAALRANVLSLGLDARVRVVALEVGRALTTLAESGASFDLVLVDPPYAEVPTGGVARALAPLGGGGLLAEGGVVVLEHRAGDTPPPMLGLAIASERVYGDTALAFLRRSEGP
jgi:16S rRNA (guanine966-N2)-methyltransferase